MKIRGIDHVGVIVNDLAAAKAFFLDLGLEVLGEWEVERERVVERVIGLDNVKNAAVMLGVPGGQATIELVQFVTPADGAGIRRTRSCAVARRVGRVGHR